MKSANKQFQLPTGVNATYSFFKETDKQTISLKKQQRNSNRPETASEVLLDKTLDKLIKRK